MPRSSSQALAAENLSLVFYGFRVPDVAYAADWALKAYHNYVCLFSQSVSQSINRLCKSVDPLS